MTFNFALPLRLLQLIFAIIVLGLASFVSHWWTDHWYSHSPDEVNFIVFCAAWTLLVLVYLIVAPWRFPTFAHKFGILAAEVVTMIFWFAGFIALAVWLNDRICFGSVCASAKAATVFAAFSWLAFAATCMLASLHVWRTRGTSEKTSAPPMRMQGV
ncbi:hypothetical protein K490DRAFT_45903 [Saccharata proteae CBS 121410]|uniref:MARVEL domain-containing protein n=1 Tax=Saccharata proteae CBS 121410 TaxID=1314787 RepID=A0A9P4HTV6_9PEZI|nr:hypothetical protein K490DRAFT_45903 [Saccharata proteae CBS 121410]